MIANFTEETCTGTGDVLTMQGETAGNLPYSIGFADGALAAYVVKDSLGSIKVAGVGIYASGANTITRTDVWNYNGTIATSYPSSNISLSAGTHTITCEVVSELILGLAGSQPTADAATLSGHTQPAAGSSSSAVTVDRQYSAPFLLKYPKKVVGLRCGVKSFVAASVSEIGISRMVDGNSADSYIARGAVVTTSNNNQAEYTLPSPIVLIPGWYCTHFISDSAVAIEYVAGDRQGWSPIEGVGGTDRNTPGSYDYKDNASVDGTLVADPTTITSSQFNQTYPNIWLV